MTAGDPRAVDRPNYGTLAPPRAWRAAGANGERRRFREGSSPRTADRQSAARRRVAWPALAVDRRDRGGDACRGGDCCVRVAGACATGGNRDRRGVVVGRQRDRKSVV